MILIERTNIAVTLKTKKEEKIMLSNFEERKNILSTTMLYKKLYSPPIKITKIKTIFM